MFFRNKKLFILLIGIFVLVALIGFSLKSRDQVTAPERFVLDAVGWVQDIIHTPVNFIRNQVTGFKELKDARDENRELKEQLAQSDTFIYQIQELEKENEELRKTLDKTESLRDYNPIQATVISRSPERWIEQVTIDKGTKHGIKPNMAVMTMDGMVGKIQVASKSTSTVQLLSGFDQFNRISATISREEGNDVFGLIEEYDEERKVLLFKIIEESEQNIEKGDLVMSSGKGGVFPEGLLIGQVEDVMPDAYGLTSTALVTPAADMYDVNNVIVVDPLLSYENLQDEEEEEDEE